MTVTKEESLVTFSLEKVGKVYEGKNQVVALEDIDLEIQEGEIYGIIGMSGAGKSTLVRTLNRLEEVSSGRVCFQGKDLKELSKKELNRARQKIGMIFQGFHLLNQKTVAQNIRIALKIAGIPKGDWEQTVDHMLDVVGLQEKKDAYPAELSGGQKQRVAIARALATNPKVLLCDEATSALDPGITAEILNLLKKINEELHVTIVLITHEMSVVEAICHQVAVLHQGRIVEHGPVTELFVHPKSEITRKMVFPENEGIPQFDRGGRRCARLVFDGTEALEPIIAGLMAKERIAVSILQANTKSVGGIGFGQMIVALPETEEEVERAISYFQKVGVNVEELERERR